MTCSCASDSKTAWWAPYTRWPVIVGVLWLVLAAMRVPVVADTALVPVIVLPAVLSRWAPAVGGALSAWLRFACAVGPITLVHLRNPEYFATVRGPDAPAYLTDVPTRGEIWGQIAAIELLLLIAMEIAIVSIAMVVAQRNARHGGTPPR